MSDLPPPIPPRVPPRFPHRVPPQAPHGAPPQASYAAPPQASHGSPQSLEYLPPDSAQRRPEILTAIGVTSVAVGTISFLVSLATVLMSFSFLIASLQPPTLVAGGGGISTTMPTTPAIPQGTVTIAGIATDPATVRDGLVDPARGDIVRMLSQNRAMTPERERQLDLLVAMAGKKMFPFAVDDPSIDLVKANISAVGTLPGSGGARGADYFVIGVGRVEVYDDHAVFRPDNSGDSVSVIAANPLDAQDAQDAAGGAGNATIIRSTRTTSAGGGGSIATSTTITSTKVAFGSPAAAGLSLGESLLSTLLAIYLLVAGILVLRGMPVGGKLHWIYAVIKIPLTLLAAVAGWWMWTGIMEFGAAVQANAATGGTAAAAPAWASGITMVFAILFAVVALIYPIALLFVLRSRGVRAYYNSIE